MSSVTDWEAASNPVKENRAGNIGKAVDRYEGPLKVTGTAPYAYEVEPPSPPAYGVMVSAEIASGRIVSIDTAAAEASPGVTLVWTHLNVPAQRVLRRHAAQGPRPERYDFFTPSPRPALQSDRVYFFGQQVAIVVADTFENATAAAAKVAVTYEADAPMAEFHAHLDEGVQPPGETDTEIGDFAAAFGAAPVTIDDVWRTPLQNHCQMEPCATTAWWDGDQLTVNTSVQMVRFAQNSLAETLMMPGKSVRLLTKYVGGGFGGKGSFYEDLVLASLRRGT